MRSRSSCGCDRSAPRAIWDIALQMGGVGVPIHREKANFACLLRGKPQGRKIGSDNRIPGEPARLGCFAVIRFRQRTVWNLQLVVSQRSERRGKMCEHEVLRSHPLCHSAKIGSQALAIKGSRGESAVPVWPQYGMY